MDRGAHEHLIQHDIVQNFDAWFSGRSAASRGRSCSMISVILGPARRGVAPRAHARARGSSQDA
jgi:hypothetical protein